MLDFGLTFKGDLSVARTVQLAQRAEHGGFSHLWIFDSHIHWREYSIMLGVLAGTTEILRLGPCVTNPGVRELTVVASEFASLNIVSGGRAVCGVGRGDLSCRGLGNKPATVENMMVFVEQLRTLAEGGMVEVNGRKQCLKWANPDFKLPIWIAGYGPKVLAAAGRHADGVILQMADVDLIKWFISLVHEGARAAGRDPKSIRIQVAAPAFIHEDRATCRHHVRWFPAMVGNLVADLVQKHYFGELPAGLSDYVKASKDLRAISDEIIDRFTVVGTVEDHIARLNTLKEIGVDQFNMYLMSGDEKRILDQYCNEIMVEVNK